MKVIKISVLVLILLLLISIVAYPVYLHVMQRQSNKRVFESLSLLQKAFVVAKLDEEKSKLNKALDKTKELRKYMDHYDFKKTDQLSTEIYKVANAVMQAKKSAVMSGAHIAQLVGEVNYLEGGTRVVQVESNMKIRSGDVLTMKKGAGVEIIFIDGSTITLRYPASLVFTKIEENKISHSLNVSMELKNGEVSFTASKITDYQPKFELAVGKIHVLYSLNAMGRASLNASLLTTTVACLEGSLLVQGGERDRKLGPQQILRVSNTMMETVYSLPPMPLAEEPANYKTIETSGKGKIQFRWSKVYNAAGYVFELADNTVFANCLARRNGYSGTSLTLPLPGKGTYYWRVAALNEASERGHFSDIREFKVVGTRQHELLVDQTPPPLTLEPIRIFGTTAIVRGRTEAHARVTVNNQLVIAKDDGSFSAIITLYQSGKNRIKVIARDASDNETMLEKWVFIKIY
ncbi:MAG: hypothetical protein GXO69_06390 [Acidobacteria bacterium]|nr:hypothetical protein [Acidobacteriota bacterium]